LSKKYPDQTSFLLPEGVKAAVKELADVEMVADADIYRRALIHGLYSLYPHFQSILDEVLEKEGET